MSIRTSLLVALALATPAAAADPLPSSVQLEAGPMDDGWIWTVEGGLASTEVVSDRGVNIMTNLALPGSIGASDEICPPSGSVTDTCPVSDWTGTVWLFYAQISDAHVSQLDVAALAFSGGACLGCFP